MSDVGTYQPIRGMIVCASGGEYVKAKDYEALRAENERLGKRDGNANIELILPEKDDPFNRIDLKIVDFGVSDNCYVVTSEEIETLKAKLSEAKAINRAFAAVLKYILHDLPTNRDWLDPDIERTAIELVRQYEVKQTEGKR